MIARAQKPMYKCRKWLKDVPNLNNVLEKNFFFSKWLHVYIQITSIAIIYIEFYDLSKVDV